MAYPIGLNFQVNKIMDAFYAQQKALKEPAVEVDEFNKEPPRNVLSYGQSTSDVISDTLQSARNIGDLERGKTRLNIVSALTGGDLVDFYKFKIVKDGKLAIGVTTDKGVNIQLMKRDGTIIADSTSTSGSKADNWMKLGTGELSLAKGDYYVKVTRGDGVSRDERPNYAIQLSMSKYYEKDYDTTESPAASVNTMNGKVGEQNASAMNSLLNAFGLGGLFDISV
jgi:hypothetical protein